jgi:5-methylcytosine-specific restriction endonuclease McrA
MDDEDSTSPEIITRKQAKQRGLVRYFTGKPCPKGHLAERFVSYGQCLACVTASRDAWYYANKERARAKNIEWHKNNQDRKRARDAAWRSRNPEKFRQSILSHYLANPEMYAVYRANRRARKRSAPGEGISAADIRALIERQGGRCVYCRRKTKLTLDHIVPLAGGGAHDVRNAQMACKSCNSSKGDKDPVDFAKTRGMLF